eukprot:3579732-Heterocapsa_arctica.AAC.1
MRSSSTVISPRLKYIPSMLAWRALFRNLRSSNIPVLVRLLTANGKYCVISPYGTNPPSGSGLKSLIMLSVMSSRLTS